jgi:hypothetical protein
LGSKASTPSVDNDGAALLTGAIYFNTVSNEMLVYTGAAWVSISNTTSATAAAASAASASTSATTATTQATNAATSASNAAAAYATIASNYLTLDFSGDFGLITDAADSTSDYGVLA